ncbi:hypothetical protein E3E35_08305 [Thermococcus sp. GR7]|uniref:hypothetical protein n=1 Tax=unclassified Thermococcus TaxID=2627626 RepID=UPI001431850C|nr:MULTISPECIES: hypothetical protein [unclassified Thermococcus]NJE47399.1 hypothetical protein [Thermococcus sp. GR7]NJE78894.1 hypothetical protein [Thermococcus sp. GR4]NJF23111.1 hypothetical protein [Thermococcus sp. GR5]
MSFEWKYRVVAHESPRFKIAEYLKDFTAVLLLLWLFKGPLRLEEYNDYMVYAIIGLIFAFELLSVGKWFGVTLSGIIFALAKGAFWTSVFLFFGKWLGMSKTLSGYAGTAFAYAVVLTIAGLLMAKFDEKKLDIKVEKKAYEFNGADFGDVKLRGSGKAYPIRFGRKKVGWVLDGEFTVEAETPLGAVRKKLISPVAVWTSENITGKKTSPDPSFVERANELINPDRLYKRGKGDTVVDLGFIKVYEGDGFEYVKLPFIEVIETPSGHDVKIGPMRFREGHPERPPSEMLTIRELANGFQLTKVGDRLRIQTDEYSIEVDGEKVLYKSGSESLSLGRDHVSLRSGEVSITVGRGRAKIRIEDVVISAKEGKVRIRAGGKSYTVENKDAYRLVMVKAKEIVEEQSTELIEGLGIDRARLSRRVKELLDELMEFLG